MTLFTTCWTSFELWTASASRGRRPAAARRGIPSLLLGLHAVLRARLLAVRDAGGIEGAAHDLVAHTRKILDSATANEDDRVLLQVVALAWDVGGDLHAIGQTHARDLAKRRVRLLRGRCVDARADPTPLRRREALLAALARLEARSRNLALGLDAALAYELIDGRHVPGDASKGPVIRLYRAAWSTNVERVTLALGHKGLEAESIWIDYGDRRPVEQVSGQPLVPVVDFDGEIVFDSPRIIARLDELHPNPPLLPADRARRAELEVFVEWFEHVWQRPPNEIERILGLPETDPHQVHELAQLMNDWLDFFESMLNGREYLFGNEFSAADCIAYPFVKYAAGRDPADGELFHRILDEHQSVDGRPQLAAWIERISQRPQA